ncbi:molybdenum cofactor biosynthesis protein MoaE [Nocardioides sp. Kera G14]|uniref:molybdenum cofactor biosynthesis protein MoaE n=1 Tax=Nocardioides sp. Kera G14 TaxID=2884264 RepID=UPI001D10AD10|nr:molybdenum cofactor biosynthesis protein MoaE [Nocardioides sp. Kera G14]UDY24615.1 molybdenum cofactor biosynthesis protein MoaE [Nocardioides sp. Kera G14]
MNPVRLVALRDTPLDVTEVLAALEDGTSGGVDLFIGRVRDHDHGQGVSGLVYEAHPSALEELTKVAEEIADSFQVTALAAVHRTGALDVGDIAVIVGTASAHRADTFDATRALIDTLKARVPIWKHQRFADGSDEWVGLP